MTNQSEVINSLAKRSDISVMVCTFFFALVGSVILLVSSFVSFNGFWGIWIPYCGLSIPALHYLSRELIQTKARLADLEARLNTIQAAEQGAPSRAGKAPV